MRKIYLDVVIGAPYEEGNGAVYIYLGSSKGIRLHPTNGYYQRIAASDFVGSFLNLRGFGISLAAADFDNNGYPGILRELI